MHRLLREDPGLPGQRVREMLTSRGSGAARRSSMTTCARCGRCSAAAADVPAHRVPARASSASSICGSRAGDPGRLRPDAARLRGRRLPALLARRRRRAGVLQGGARPAVGDRRCLARWARCRRRWCGTARGRCTPAAGGRPRRSPRSAGSSVGWRFLEPAGLQAKGVSRAAAGVHGDELRAGPPFANELDFQEQLDRWFDERANVRFHRTLRCRPVDRLARGATGCGRCPSGCRISTAGSSSGCRPSRTCASTRNDYSLDPRLVGRRVEVRVSQREVIAVALDTGELAAGTGACSPRHRTITALEHARALRDAARRPGRARGRAAAALPATTRLIPA